MDNLPTKHRILYLLMNGCSSMDEIATLLDIEEEDVVEAIKELEFDGAIKTHTVH